MVKIRRLTVSDFRGFRDKADFYLYEGLNVFYGPNGFGKTSFSEALEWVLFGYTSKRKNARSKNEFKDSYRNLHSECWPKVELEVLLDGSSVVVTREAIGDEKDILMIDGTNVSDLSRLGFSAQDTPCPVIPQHALTSFIHTEPKSRWAALSDMLGLSPLVRLRSDIGECMSSLKKLYRTEIDVVEQVLKDLSTGGGIFENIVHAIDSNDVTPRNL